MHNFGFFRLSANVPEVKLADPQFNARHIANLIDEASARNSRLSLFPELSVSGYSCADLFNQSLLLDKVEETLLSLPQLCKKQTVVVGAPLRFNNRLYNCAVVVNKSGILGVVPKSFLPNYNEFYEKRWFASGIGIHGKSISIGSRNDIPFGTDLLFNIDGVKFGIEICEDLWVPVPPAASAVLAGADCILNLSATNELIGKHDYLLDLIKSRSATLRCAYVYASAGWGESSTDLVFSGNGIIAENGVILCQTKRFSIDGQSATTDIDIEKLRNDRRRFSTFSDPAEFHNGEYGYRLVDATPSEPLIPDTDLLRAVNPTPFVPSDASNLRTHCEEIISIQAWGLARRLKTLGSGRLTVGISGGLDSTLALLVAVKALDMMGFPRKEITAVTMPGFGTTSRTRSNAWKLMELLGVSPLEIPIGKAVMQHFADIGQDPDLHDATYENSQARERTQILMDLANKTGGIVLGTGDLSELALGWCTYNGDQMSMYGVNASIPKTLVKHLVGWFASEAESNGDSEIACTLRDIIDTPISPELIPAEGNADTIGQKTEDLVGPYDLHDFTLFHFLRNSFSPEKIRFLAIRAFGDRFDTETIDKWMNIFFRRFFSQQFKRSCMPDGPKVGSVCLSPRGDWRMPSDASASAWIPKV